MPAPADGAFRYLADPVNRPRWQASLRRVALDPGDPTPRVGLSWQEWTVIPGVAPRLRITRLEPGRVWAERGDWHGVRADLVLTFEPEAGGVLVHADAEVRGTGPWAIPARVGALLGGRAIAADLCRAGRLIRAA